MKDLIIIGAGPGGVTAAIYAKRSNLDLLVSVVLHFWKVFNHKF